MLINCVAYGEGHKLSDIPTDDIDQWLHKPGCFVWVALKDASEAELRQMQSEFDLHELALEDALNGHQRPKVEEYGDTLFVVMKMPALASDPPPSLDPTASTTKTPGGLAKWPCSSARTLSCPLGAKASPGFGRAGAL